MEPGYVAIDCVGMSWDGHHHSTAADADWSDVAMAAIVATVLLGVPAVCLLLA